MILSLTDTIKNKTNYLVKGAVYCNKDKSKVVLLLALVD
jgi:hypothetical protein